jgi:hypothetical protein
MTQNTQEKNVNKAKLYRLLTLPQFKGQIGKLKGFEISEKLQTF